MFKEVTHIGHVNDDNDNEIIWTDMTRLKKDMTNYTALGKTAWIIHTLDMISWRDSRKRGFVASAFVSLAPIITAYFAGGIAAVYFPLFVVSVGLFLVGFTGRATPIDIRKSLSYLRNIIPDIPREITKKEKEELLLVTTSADPMGALMPTSGGKYQTVPDHNVQSGGILAIPILGQIIIPFLTAVYGILFLNYLGAGRLLYSDLQKDGNYLLSYIIINVLYDGSVVYDKSAFSKHIQNNTAIKDDYSYILLCMFLNSYTGIKDGDNHDGAKQISDDLKSTLLGYGIGKNDKQTEGKIVKNNSDAESISLNASKKQYLVNYHKSA